MSRTFEVTRADGRSNTQVMLDLVASVEPAHVFSYQALADALVVGSTRAFDRRAVIGIVAGAQPRLLKELQRTLTNVRGYGFRVAAAAEHRGLAVVRTKRADVQLKRGWEILMNVRASEMDEPNRRAHEGTLMIVGALYQQQRGMERRLRAVEDAIRDLGGKDKS